MGLFPRAACGYVAAEMFPQGTYRYEIRRAGQLVAREEATFDGYKIVGWRESVDGSDRSEVDADISSDGFVTRIRLRYVRGPFSRNASYEANDDFLRGSVSALGGRNALTAKLGRFREINADFVLFRALTLDHVRTRGLNRWTG